MATKKEKRAAALARREAYMAEVRAEGLESLRRAREREALRKKAALQAVAEINEHHREILAKHGIHEGGTSKGHSYEEASDEFKISL